MTAGYVAEACANCRHAKGDHRASGSLSLTVTYGVCLVDGCDCKAFTARGCVSCEDREAARPEGYCELCWPPEALHAA